MKTRVFALCLAAALCSLTLSAQNIPAGDDVWDSVGGGATDTTLTSADWYSLCGVNVPDTAVQLKGFNLPGYGTGDTVVTRQATAVLPGIGSTATVPILLKALSFVNDGPHPCSPLTIRVRQDVAQIPGTMTIKKTSANGGTFVATVNVNAIVEAVNSSGVVVGSTYVSGALGDQSTSPWSYNPPIGGAPQPSPWYPSVDPVTQKPVKTCRRGAKTLPAKHCYQPAPICPIQPVPVDPVPVGDATVAVVANEAVAQPVEAEPCSIQAQPADTQN